MGKNNRCKGKKKKQRDAQHFSITPKEIRQAEAQYNSHIQHYDMYRHIEAVVGTETMIEWFGGCPDPEEMKMGGN